MPYTTALGRLMCTVLLAAGLGLTGCGRDSYVVEAGGPESMAVFGEGIDVAAPTGTVVRLFADHVPITHNGRPAIPLQELIGANVVPYPELYGFRLIGTDGFYANMPGKGYGDNTWQQLALGYLDLVDVHVVFETAQDPMLRKGHNVKWLIRAEVLRALEVSWSDGRKLAAVTEVPTTTVPEGYAEAGAAGLLLADVVAHVLPGDRVPGAHVYRLLGRDGTSLPRLLTWEEMHTAYYLPGSDRVVMLASLGAAYEVSRPRTIRVEGGALLQAGSAGEGA